MNILISGGSGFIGTALTHHFKAQGHTVTHLSRQRKPQQAYWNIASKQLDLGNTPSPDIVINLTGENIADKRWSKRQKQEIVDSRISSTELLVNFINNCTDKPRLFISGSAIGYYGHRGIDVVDELSGQGHEFSSDLCMQWEATSKKLDKSIRRVNIRTGIVLSHCGGTLKKMLLPFKLGLGGKLGNGKQYLSWISMLDYIKAIDFIIQHEEIKGPVNMVAPNPVSNSEFTQALGKHLHRPTFLPMPAWLVRLLFGEMGQALLLSSTRVNPSILLKHHFKFAHPHINEAMDYALHHESVVLS